MQPSSHDSIIATPTDRSASNTTSAVTSSPRRQDVDAKTATAHSKKIGVWVSSNQCCATLSTQPAFSGVTKQRIARFYIGGINKSSTETGLRNFLSDRNVKITNLRFFNRDDKISAYAQLNVPIETREIIESKNFWPHGVYVKPWLSKQRFLNKFSNHTNNGSAEY